MPVDAKKVVSVLKIKGESPKGRFSLYFDKSTFKEFQEACEKEDVSASRVLELLMREFIESAKGKK
jgi:hypothetical protein